MHRLERLPTAVPGVHVMRTSGHTPFVGVKDTFMISRFEEGRSRFWTHGQVREGQRGTVVVFQAGDVHRDVEREGVVTLQLIRLHADLVEQVTREVCVQSCFDPGDVRAVTLHRLHDAVAAHADRFTLECVLAEALGALTGATRHAHTRPVRRALAMIRDHVSEPLSLDALAQHAGLDKFHLCRAFRAQVGMAPYAYLTQLRIMHAKQLLANGAKPKDIAPRVGLYDQSQLNRHFRRIVGMTPQQFARRV